MWRQCALLSLKTGQPKLEVTMEVDSDSNYTPEEKVTYEKIREYILEKHRLKISTLCIAQIKDKCGLQKQLKFESTGGNKVPQCTPKREEVIMEAFRHFGII